MCIPNEACDGKDFKSPFAYCFPNQDYFSCCGKSILHSNFYNHVDLCHRQKPKVKGEKQENIQMFLTVKKSVGIFKTGTKLVIFKNHETSMYRCPLSSCKKETKVPDSLRKHIIRGTCFKEDISDDIVIPFELFYTPFCLNLKYKMLTCLECKILVASKDTFDHMRDNHSEEFYYYICWTAFTQMVNYHKIEETELSFFSKFPLSDHEFSQIYGLETTKGFSCSVCSFIFADRDGFNHHRHKDLYETMEIPRLPVEVNFQFLKKKSHKVVYHDSVETVTKVYDESQRKKPGVNGVEDGFLQHIREKYGVALPQRVTLSPGFHDNATSYNYVLQHNFHTFFKKLQETNDWTRPVLNEEIAARTKRAKKIQESHVSDLPQALTQYVRLYHYAGLNMLKANQDAGILRQLMVTHRSRYSNTPFSIMSHQSSDRIYCDQFSDIMMIVFREYLNQVEFPDNPTLIDFSKMQLLALEDLFSYINDDQLEYPDDLDPLLKSSKRILDEHSLFYEDDEDEDIDLYQIDDEADFAVERDIIMDLEHEQMQHEIDQLTHNVDSNPYDFTRAEDARIRSSFHSKLNAALPVETIPQMDDRTLWGDQPDDWIGRRLALERNGPFPMGRLKEAIKNPKSLEIIRRLHFVYLTLFSQSRGSNVPGVESLSILRATAFHFFKQGSWANHGKVIGTLTKLGYCMKLISYMEYVVAPNELKYNLAKGFHYHNLCVESNGFFSDLTSIKLMAIEDYKKRENTAVAFDHNSKRIMINNVEFSRSIVVGGIEKGIKKASKLLDNVLLFDNPQLSARFYTEKGSEFYDDQHEEKIGYNFIDDKRNCFNQESHSLMLIKYIEDNPDLQLRYLTGENADSVQTVYMDQCRNFLKTIMFLIQMTSGAPARMTELCRTKICNGRDSRRNIFYLNGSMALVNYYNKNKLVFGVDYEIPRYLPHIVAELITKYLVLVRPFMCFIAELQKWSANARARLDYYLFTDSEGVWGANNMYKILASTTREYLGHTYGIRILRQAVQMVHHYSYNEIVQKMLRYAATVDAQMGHTSKTGEKDYGGHEDMIQGGPTSSATFIACSKLWHIFCRMEQITKTLRGDMTTGESILPFDPPKRNFLYGEKDSDVTNEPSLKKRKIEALVYPSNFNPYTTILDAESVPIEKRTLKALKEFQKKSGLAYTGFRNKDQALSVQYSLQNKQNLVCVLPTGAGKSLTFLIPALVDEGLTAVLVPYVPLLKELAEKATKLGIPTLTFTSDNDYDSVVSGHHRLVFMTYDQAARNGNNVNRLALRRIVVDEAHCLRLESTFRPIITELNQFFSNHGNCQVIFLSATFSIKELIVTSLATMVQNTRVIQAIDTTRPNIEYSVLKYTPTKRGNNYLAPSKDLNFLKSLSRTLSHTYPHDSSARVIVFFNTVELLRRCKEWLNNRSMFGQLITAHHSGGDHGRYSLSEDEKDANIEAWKEGRCPIMFATKSLGVGIDYKFVETVIHVGFPDNMYNYIQQSGRAGRNGQKSRAILIQGNTINYYDDKDDSPLIECYVSKERVQSDKYISGTECLRYCISEFVDRAPTSCLADGKYELCSYCKGSTIYNEDSRIYRLRIQPSLAQIYHTHIADVLNAQEYVKRFTTHWNPSISRTETYKCMFCVIMRNYFCGHLPDKCNYTCKDIIALNDLGFPTPQPPSAETYVTDNDVSLLFFKNEMRKRIKEKYGKGEINDEGVCFACGGLYHRFNNSAKMHQAMQGQTLDICYMGHAAISVSFLLFVLLLSNNENKRYFPPGTMRKFLNYLERFEFFLELFNLDSYAADIRTPKGRESFLNHLAKRTILGDTNMFYYTAQFIKFFRNPDYLLLDRDQKSLLALMDPRKLVQSINEMDSVNDEAERFKYETKYKGFDIHFPRSCQSNITPVTLKQSVTALNDLIVNTNEDFFLTSRKGSCLFCRLVKRDFRNAKHIEEWEMVGHMKNGICPFMNKTTFLPLFQKYKLDVNGKVVMVNKEKVKDPVSKKTYRAVGFVWFKTQFQIYANRKLLDPNDGNRRSYSRCAGCQCLSLSLGSRYRHSPVLPDNENECPLNEHLILVCYYYYNITRLSVLNDEFVNFDEGQYYKGYLFWDKFSQFAKGQYYGTDYIFNFIGYKSDSNPLMDVVAADHEFSQFEYFARTFLTNILSTDLDRTHSKVFKLLCFEMKKTRDYESAKWLEMNGSYY